MGAVAASTVGVTAKIAAATAAAPQVTQAAAAPEEDLTARKARWANIAASGEHLANMQFTTVDLDVMSLKILRGLCMQHRVLPPCAMEKGDFVQALLPLCGSSAPP